MEEKLNVPMWGIVGDNSLNELAGIIVELRSEIKEIEKDVLKKVSDIETINNRINMYVKSVLKIEDYDNEKNLLVINHKNEACIYPHDLIDENTELSNLPETTEKYPVTLKQAEKIRSYLTTYGDLVFDHEDLMDEYDEVVDSHDELWKQIHESLEETIFLQVHDSKKEDNSKAEIFNKNKHLLFIVKEESGLWGFKYIRKKDEKKFYKYIDDKQEKSEEA